jgi:hypothetical protein
MRLLRFLQSLRMDWTSQIRTGLRGIERCDAPVSQKSLFGGRCRTQSQEVLILYYYSMPLCCLFNAYIIESGLVWIAFCTSMASSMMFDVHKNNARFRFGPQDFIFDLQDFVFSCKRFHFDSQAFVFDCQVC